MISVFMKWSCDMCILSADEAELRLSELKWLIHGHSVTNLTLSSDSVNCDFKEITVQRERTYFIYVMENSYNWLLKCSCRGHV